MYYFSIVFVTPAWSETHCRIQIEMWHAKANYAMYVDSLRVSESEIWANHFLNINQFGSAIGPCCALPIVAHEQSNLYVIKVSYLCSPP
jgi:hypothetical protein